MQQMQFLSFESINQSFQFVIFSKGFECHFINYLDQRYLASIKEMVNGLIWNSFSVWFVGILNWSRLLSKQGI